MAAICSISMVPAVKTLNSIRDRNLPVNFSIPSAFPRSKPSFQRPRTQAAKSSPIVEEGKKRDEESMGIDALQRFINLNLSNWTGSFYQFDSHGNLMHRVSTKLAVSSYGEDELISLIQTLYIQQPPSSTSIAGYDPEPEWAEYKIKEANMFTIDKYQQTAGMLETVLRQGVLGEDDIGEESPKNLKLPSRQPSVVCENCFYSMEKDMRARAFHIMDPKGVLEMLLIFLEERGDGVPFPPSLDISKDNTNKITPFLGKWKGHSITKRSGVYGATLAEADTDAVLEMDDKGQLIQWKGHSITKRSGVYGATLAEADTDAVLEMDDKGQLIQVITSTSSGGEVTTNVRWTGTLSDNLITIDGGFQMTLLPGGMYMACPYDVAKSVAESKSFHLDFCWLESPGKRQRLVRTYDVEGLAVSSTYIFETKL